MCAGIVKARFVVVVVVSSSSMAIGSRLISLTCACIARLLVMLRNQNPVPIGTVKCRGIGRLSHMLL